MRACYLVLLIITIKRFFGKYITEIKTRARFTYSNLLKLCLYLIVVLYSELTTRNTYVAVYLLKSILRLI